MSLELRVDTRREDIHQHRPPTNSLYINRSVQANSSSSRMFFYPGKIVVLLISFVLLSAASSLDPSPSHRGQQKNRIPLLSCRYLFSSLLDFAVQLLILPWPCCCCGKQCLSMFGFQTHWLRSSVSIDIMVTKPFDDLNVYRQKNLLRHPIVTNNTYRCLFKVQTFWRAIRSVQCPVVRGVLHTYSKTYYYI